MSLNVCSHLYAPPPDLTPTPFKNFIDHNTLLINIYCNSPPLDERPCCSYKSI